MTKQKSLKTRLWIIIGFIFALGFIGTVYAVSELDRERSYERADFVFYGEVLSLEVLSESTRTIENNNYVDIAGKAIYSIKIHNFIKNSFDDEVISAYGFYYLEKPSETSPDLYKIGDKLVFYVNIFNENESSYDYLIDSAQPEPYLNDDQLCPPGLVFDWDICIEECRNGQYEDNGICRDLLPNSGNLYPLYFIISVASIFVIIAIVIVIIFVNKRK